MKKFIKHENTSGEGGDTTFISPSKLNKEGRTGIIAQGIYRGSQEVEGKYGTQLNHQIEGMNGKKMVINGAGNLQAQLSFKKVSEGTPVQITYNGKIPMKDGPRKGTEAHNFTVETGEIV